MADGKELPPYMMAIKADPSPTIEMFRALAECHRENADHFDAMCDRLAALWTEQNPVPLADTQRTDTKQETTP